MDSYTETSINFFFFPEEGASTAIEDDFDSDLNEVLSTWCSILKSVFLPEDPKESCKRLRLLIPKKNSENDTTRHDDETSAIFDKLIEYLRTKNKKNFN